MPAVARRRVRTIALAADHALHLEARDRITLRNADGRICVAIHITPAGPVLRFEGAELGIYATADLKIEADRIAIHGREDVAITSGGTATVEVVGDLETFARSQHHTATLGNVSLRANDDVRLNGERVLMNC